MTKAKCFCGSETFGVELLVFPGKTQIHLRCRGCDCLRRISSPGYSADYLVKPEFVKEPPKEDAPIEKVSAEMATLATGLRDLKVPCDGFTPVADGLGALKKLLKEFHHHHMNDNSPQECDACLRVLRNP